jgi:hypothetical protein
MNDRGRLVPAGRLRLTADDVASLVATAGRAPSVHNTQPWSFRADGDAIELYADADRLVRTIDPAGREMLISCGAALFGLRLGMRKLGYRPELKVLPDPDLPCLVARVTPVGKARASRQEANLLAALPHRHTHRGPFTPGAVPARLLTEMQMAATAEGAELTLIDQPGQLRDLTELVLAAAGEQAVDPEITAELRRWVRALGSPARDGIPAHARAAHEPGGIGEARRPVAAEGLAPRLPQRDFRPCDGGEPSLAQRDVGQPGADSGGDYPPSVTAVLVTAADTPADWVRAGQALHRMLLHAATRWVFASLQSQPLESSVRRAELRARLGLAGRPQLLLQFGRANTAPATARRPVSETLRQSIRDRR